jgi:iron complex transport system ATP-binding protein
VKLELRDLEFSFGDKPVLKKVSFDVEDGEFLGLMGPNGSGKTTLLRCLTKYLPVEAGAILIDMKPLHTLGEKEVARNFGVVPQTSRVDFPFTAYDIVAMGRMPHSKGLASGETKEDTRVVREAMEETNSWHLAGRAFSELSGGERQRVIIARALAQEPKALLLDEPTVFLDISGQFDMMDLVKRLNRSQKITIVAVLHDINLAARYCDRIALLSQGRLEAIGTPVEVLTPEVIQSIYGVDVSVRKDPFTHAIYVMPHSGRLGTRKHGTRIHVLCGGGTGGPFMKALVDHGYSVSAGVLNVLDSDYENARDLRIPVVAEVPFAQISDDAHEQNLKLVEESKSVMVTRFPVGPGNFKNLEVARYALEAKKPVFIVAPEAGGDIDFVGGKADDSIKGLIASGAIPVLGLEGLVQALREHEVTPSEGTPPARP